MDSNKPFYCIQYLKENKKKLKYLLNHCYPNHFVDEQIKIIVNLLGRNNLHNTTDKKQIMQSNQDKTTIKNIIFIYITPTDSNIHLIFIIYNKNIEKNILIDYYWNKTSKWYLIAD